MHQWTDDRGQVSGGNPHGPSWSSAGGPVARMRPGNYGLEGFPTRDSQGVPSDGVDGWFVSMDQVLNLTRAWPDWEFAPREPYPL